MNNKKCKVTLSKNITKTQDVPIDSPINGNQKIRSDIKTKQGIIEMSALATNSDLKQAGVIFSKDFSGPYIVTSFSNIHEGGDSGNPNTLKNVSLIGFSE